MGNSRGNIYSRRNVNYTEDQNQFWAWSWDQMAQYDLPAMIGFALEETQASSISYIGHSQGTSQAFAAFSTQPDLASKIDIFIALAPVTFFQHQRNLVFTELAKLPDWGVYDLLGYQGFPVDNEIFTWIEKLFPEICGTFPLACENVIFLIGGCNTAGTCDPGDLNQTRVPVYSSHIGGAGVQDLVHYLQLSRGSTFCMYDYGAAGNLIHYGQSTPPVYNLGSMKVPTALFSGGLDNFADPMDVKTLTATLPNIVFTNIQPDYEHLDFVWGESAYQLIYPQVVTLLNKYSVSK
eukprot:TRINITY_DN3375_c0_g1_i2.p1 TRINITY_DN3375_c0_g1~~TRINITY_DN3375_c0_g1_i2.p1  ORF type:complete len:293 (+),score=28.55 TRINITY_DN3375_c0_g1_i2:330-1208(+)